MPGAVLALAAKCESAHQQVGLRESAHLASCRSSVFALVFERGFLRQRPEYVSLARMNPVDLLAWNAAAQIAFSCLLGWVMLIPLQPWGKALRRPAVGPALRAAHLDWLMLAFMQAAAAFLLSRDPLPAADWIARLLIFGGWVNPIPYLLRAFGINAFVFAGGPAQRLSAAISGVSSVAITAAWVMALVQGLL